MTEVQHQGAEAKLIASILVGNAHLFHDLIRPLALIPSHEAKAQWEMSPGSTKAVQNLGIGRKWLEYQIDSSGSSGRTRTYNPSVNSRMLCH